MTFMFGSATMLLGTTMRPIATTATAPDRAPPKRRSGRLRVRASHSRIRPITALMSAISTTERPEVRAGIRKNGTTKVPMIAPRVFAPSSMPALVPTRSSESVASIEVIGKTTPITSVAGRTTISRSRLKLMFAKNLVSNPRPPSTTMASASSATPSRATGCFVRDRNRA